MRAAKASKSAKGNGAWLKRKPVNLLATQATKTQKSAKRNVLGRAELAKGVATFRRKIRKSLKLSMTKAGESQEQPHDDMPPCLMSCKDVIPDGYEPSCA